MSLACHSTRRQLRTQLASGRARGTFVKLPVPDVIPVLAGIGLDFVVIDMEHSSLSERECSELLRSAVGVGLPALVRVPQLDSGLINRLLEAGAAGIQLSMLRRVAQTEALVAATRFAPAGRRSISLANQAAGFGALTAGEFTRLDAADPPILVGQIETRDTEDFADLLTGLDVAFVGTTDLAVDMGLGPDSAALKAAVEDVRASAAEAGIGFGGWAGSLDAVATVGLAEAQYVMVGSDLQILVSGLRAVLTL